MAQGRPRRWLGILALTATAVWSLWWAQGASNPGAGTSDGPLPGCAQGDVLTQFHRPDDWARTFLDTTYRLDAQDAPSDLVDVRRAGVAGRGQVRALVIGDLRAMHRAATHAKSPFGIESAYRSFAAQDRTFASLEQAYGYEYALRSAARPGHSEHQLGTTIDVDDNEAWLAAHAWEYGWVVSYPPDRSPGWTCYKPEPWHLRYIGRDAAAAVHASGVSLREWLWEAQR